MSSIQNSSQMKPFSEICVTNLVKYCVSVEKKLAFFVGEKASIIHPSL